MQQQNANSYLFGGNAPYVEELYEAYLNNPGSVPENWRAYFDQMQNVPAVDGSTRSDVVHSSVIASFAERAKQGPIRTVSASSDPEMGRKRVAVTVIQGETGKAEQQHRHQADGRTDPVPLVQLLQVDGMTRARQGGGRGCRGGSGRSG